MERYLSILVNVFILGKESEIHVMNLYRKRSVMSAKGGEGVEGAAAEGAATLAQLRRAAWGGCEVAVRRHGCEERT